MLSIFNKSQKVQIRSYAQVPKPSGHKITTHGSFSVRHFDPSTIEIIQNKTQQDPSKINFNEVLYAKIMEEFERYISLCHNKKSDAYTYFHLYNIEIKIDDVHSRESGSWTFNDIDRYASFVKEKFGWKMSDTFIALKKLSTGKWDEMLIPNPYAQKVAAFQAAANRLRGR